MKITSVECYLGTGAIGGFVTMKINTDSGIYGWGEAGLAYGKSAEAAFGQCQDFGKLILGMDPFNTEEIWEHLHRHTFWGMGGGVVITSAMAAIDTACWDIKGKALGLRLHVGLQLGDLLLQACHVHAVKGFQAVLCGLELGVCVVKLGLQGGGCRLLPVDVCACLLYTSPSPRDA